MRANLLLVLWEMGCWSTAVAGKRSHEAESSMALWKSKCLIPVLKLMATETSYDRKKPLEEHKRFVRGRWSQLKVKSHLQPVNKANYQDPNETRNSSLFNCKFYIFIKGMRSRRTAVSYAKKEWERTGLYAVVDKYPE